MVKWIDETLHVHFRFSLEVERVLYDGRSDNQRLAVIENPLFGRALYLDDVLQTTERDEFIYHEMLAHVPILAHGGVKDVLVIGGGDGGLIEEVLKHRSVERVTMVELDPRVVELCRNYLPAISGAAFDDPRLDLVFADGLDFVRTSAPRFDVIIVDSTDPIGPGEALFGGEFYGGCKRALRDGGVLVTQNGVPFVQGDELRQTMKSLNVLFADAGCYLATVPTYVGGPMAFGWASDDPALQTVSADELELRFAAAAIETSYYTPAVHRGAFALPPYVQRLID